MTGGLKFDEDAEGRMTGGPEFDEDAEGVNVKFGCR